MALEESYSAVMGIVTEVEQYVKVRRSSPSGARDPSWTQCELE